MTTQSNKQSQNVKVVVNNNCCPKEPKPRRRRRPAPRQEEAPSPSPDMPPVQPAMPHARGLSAYANRPMVFAPSTQMIQQGTPPIFPHYFEKPYTNREASLTEMRKAMREEFDDLREELVKGATNPRQVQEILSGVNNLQARAFEDLGAGLPPYVAPSSSSSVNGNTTYGGGNSSGGDGDPSFSFSRMDTDGVVPNLVNMFESMSITPQQSSSSSTERDGYAPQSSFMTANSRISGGGDIASTSGLAPSATPSIQTIPPPPVSQMSLSSGSGVPFQGIPGDDTTQQFGSRVSNPIAGDASASIAGGSRVSNEQISDTDPISPYNQALDLYQQYRRATGRRATELRTQIKALAQVYGVDLSDNPTAATMLRRFSEL